MSRVVSKEQADINKDRQETRAYFLVAKADLDLDLSRVLKATRTYLGDFLESARQKATYACSGRLPNYLNLLTHRA